MNRDPALVKVLARQPGTKEARYVHLLSGDIPAASSADANERPAIANRESQAKDTSRLESLESEVAQLRKDIADLKQQLATFRKQFE
jgi:hypothetical protein